MRCAGSVGAVSDPVEGGRLVAVDDTRLHVVERGEGELGLLVLHGGPGLDHTMFGSWLDSLEDVCRLFLVDQRSQGRSDRTSEDWSIQQMARDVEALAESLALDRYVVLGHSFGAFVALQHAVDFAGRPTGTIVSSGVPDLGYLDSHVEQSLATFEPEELREQVTSSWERETQAETQEDVASIVRDQFPFHFADPRDPRIEEVLEEMDGAVYSPEVLSHFAATEYGGIEVEDHLPDVTHPVLVLAGRHDRACSVEASEAIAAGVPDARLVVFEESGHMTFIEENEAYLTAVRDFLTDLG
jgi:proline iminopeptidase